jgi:uncharacterized membrane protein
MKSILLSAFLLFQLAAFAQLDTAGSVEPYRETSYTNKDLLLLALAGLAILMAIYFLFRRARKRGKRQE